MATAYRQAPIEAPEQAARTATIQYDHSWLPTPLHWTLRYEGQSVGGYGVVRGGIAKFADRARAEQVAAVWLATGVTPAFQGGAA